MATTITCNYIGDGQTELTHGPTNSKILTDLPPDNGGKGRLFSPTDLLGASLSSCILTIMGKSAEKYKHDFSGASIEIEKIMNESPRRVGKFIMKITFPKQIPIEYRDRYLAAIKACPVHMSLHPDIKVEYEVVN